MTPRRPLRRPPPRALYTGHERLSNLQPAKWGSTPAPIYNGPLVYDADLDCMVPKWGRNRFDWQEKRSDLACPYVQSGGMPEITSMTDGKRYETRRNYYRSVARAGCEIVGHDQDWQRHIKSPLPSAKALENDIGRDVSKAWEIEQSRVPSYGPEARRLMRKQRRAERATKA